MKHIEGIKLLNNATQVNPITGDASDRKYFRVITQEKSYILSQDKEERHKLFLEQQQYFKRGGFYCPEIYYSDKKRLVIEDLGDKTLLSFLGQCSEAEERSEYLSLIEDITKIQKMSTKDCPLESTPFNYNKYFDEAMMTHQYFVEKHLKKEMKSIVEKTIKEISNILDGDKKVCVHRDFHSRNIMRYNNKNYFIDFQDARPGSCYYDLTSLLDDCYYSLNSQLKEDLLKKFFELKTFNYSFTEYLYRYDLMKIQRTFKAIGSFYYLYFEKRKPQYLEYVGTTFSNLRMALKNKEGIFKEFRNQISEYYYGY